MNQAKTAFIKKVLSRHGQQLQHKIIASITSEGLSHPSGGISSQVIDTGGSTSFRMTLPILRRFQDMGAPLNRLTAENVLTNQHQYTRKRRKIPVHNKNVWGHMNSLSRELMYGYTREVVEAIKSQLTD